MLIRDETNNRLNSGNACYHSIQNLLFVSARKLIKYKRLTSVVLYGYETWSLTLREEHKFRLFENRLLRKILGPKRDKVAGSWRRLHN
jgi:hypothetical protein